MSKCEHLIGRMGNNNVFDTNSDDGLRQMLSYEGSALVALHKFGLGRGELLTPRQIADNRRGYLHRYNYCPYCGAELNWKHLIDEATK